MTINFSFFRPVTDCVTPVSIRKPNIRCDLTPRISFLPSEVQTPFISTIYLSLCLLSFDWRRELVPKSPRQNPRNFARLRSFWWCMYHAHCLRGYRHETSVSGKHPVQPLLSNLLKPYIIVQHHRWCHVATPLGDVAFHTSNKLFEKRVQSASNICRLLHPRSELCLYWENLAQIADKAASSFK